MPVEMGLGEGVDMLFLHENVNFAMNSCDIERVGGVIEVIHESEAAGQVREVQGDHPRVRNAQFGIEAAAMWWDIQEGGEGARSDHRRRDVQGAGEGRQGCHWCRGSGRWRRR